MRPRARRAPALALATAGFFALLLAMLLLFTMLVGTDDALYRELQLRYGVRESNLVELDAALAEYLKGDRTALEATEAFNERELAHMEDVAALFDLGRFWLRLLFLMAACFLFLGLLLYGPGRLRCARDASLAAGCLLLLLAGALIIWGIVDFTGLFTAFHKAFFRNDLWLLDPATDVLIRICPEGMFRDMAVRIAIETLAFALCLPLLFSVPSNLIGRLVHVIRNQGPREG